jgi:hypothetical protein
MHRPTTVWWTGAAFCSALALAVFVLAVIGTGTRGTVMALRVTARFSFLLFWFAYAGRALATLFGHRFESVAKRGRELGLAFASAHLVHVALLGRDLYLLRNRVGVDLSSRTLLHKAAGPSDRACLAHLAVHLAGKFQWRYSKPAADLIHIRQRLQCPHFVIPLPHSSTSFRVRSCTCQCSKQ